MDPKYKLKKNSTFPPRVEASSEAPGASSPASADGGTPRTPQDGNPACRFS